MFVINDADDEAGNQEITKVVPDRLHTMPSPEAA